jgi:hypothetical protein
MSAHSEQLSSTQATTRKIVAVGDEPSFTELVYAHYTWWRKRHNGKAADADAAYRDVLHRFEQHNGRVVDSFWCSNLESGIALTERRRPFPLQPRLSFHRESDWATKQSPLIATELHRCDELAIRARTVLTGVRQRICLHLVAASAAHLLSLVDTATAPTTDDDTVAALEHERDAINRAERYYQHAANGQAQILYFAGMVTVAVLISVAALLFLTIEWRVGVAALVAGAIGAVVSVVQRINAGGFHVEYDVGRPYAFFLGGLRPLIGGAFAIAVAFTFSSGILHLPITDGKDHERLGLVVVSFLAGFSERWAQDTLTTALPQQGGPQSAPKHSGTAAEPASASEGIT